MGAIVCVLGSPGDPGVAAVLERALRRSPFRGEATRVERSGIATAVQARGDEAAIGAWGPVTAAISGRLEGCGGGSEAAIELARWWGEMTDAAFDRVQGDVAAVIFDARHGEVFAGRTVPFGQPLFVGGRAGRWVIATEIGQVVAGLELPWKPDAEGVARVILDRPGDGRRTAVEGIERVPPGELWQVDVGESVVQPRRTVLWVPPDVAGGWTRRRAAEAVRSSIDRATHARMPWDGCAVAVSGGLCSGAVWASVATHAAGEVGADTVVAVTDQDSASPSRESERAEAVLRRTGGQGLVRRVLGFEPMSPPVRVSGAVEQPCGLGITRLAGLLERCRARDLGVVLTGCGGRECFSGTPRWVGESLWHGRLIRFALGQLELLSQRPGNEAGGGARWARRSAGRSWLASGLSDCLAADREPRSDRELRVSALARVGASTDLENLERMAAQVGVEVRHPFLDRWVAELALELPGWVLGGAGRPLDLLRRAQRVRLPAQVVDGEDEVAPLVGGPVAARLLARRELTRPWLLVDAGVADDGGLRRILDRVAGDGASPAHPVFWRLWSAEACLRGWEHGVP